MREGEASSSPVRRVGRYALYSEIASGGMATVYLGRQRGQAGFARTVAIKRLHPQHAKEPDFVAMFLDEARLAARIRHPNVVPTLDVVATEGELFLVMEYVQGESLARLLKASRHRKESPPVRVVAAIVADILHGLHAAHEATSEKGEPLGLVHRDVSPHNVLVGTDGVARVVDFGVAKAAGRIQTTREGQLKGKIAYMAPEQITANATRRTDVYAASVVLWEALTAKRLFHGENDASVLHQVMNVAVLAPSTHVEGLDPAWDEIVLKGLEREQERRYATAREMALEIENRLQLARATEVGAWVESLAHESLAKRAAEVSSVESASDLDLVPAEPATLEPASGRHSAPAKPAERAPSPTVPDAPPVGERPAVGESTSSRLSAVSWPLHTSPGSRRPSPAVLAALGAAVVVVVGIVVVSTRAKSVPDDPSALGSAGAVQAVQSSARDSSVELPAAQPVLTAPAPVAPSAPIIPVAALSVPVVGAPRPPPQPAHSSRPPHPKSEPAPTGTKATTLGGVLDTRH